MQLGQLVTDLFPLFDEPAPVASDQLRGIYSPFSATHPGAAELSKAPSAAIWVRPDSRSPIVGQLVLTKPARILFGGRNGSSSENF